jgi:LruC domain-containing protein
MGNKSISFALRSSAILLVLAVCGCQPADPPLVSPPHVPEQKFTPPAKPPSIAPAPVVPKTLVKNVVNYFKGDLAAIAYEDVYPRADDRDFNDFLGDISPKFRLDEKNQITDIVIDFYPRAVGAWYDHSLWMVLNGVKDSVTRDSVQSVSNIVHTTEPLIHGTATATVTLYDVSNYTAQQHDAGAYPPVLETKTWDPNHDVEIFSSTHAAFGIEPEVRQSHPHNYLINTYADSAYIPAKQAARLSIHLTQPELNLYSANDNGEGEIDLSKFRVILHVKDTQQDIDLVDVDPTSVDLNPKDGSSYPHGFLIPTDWRWPQEGVHIWDAYTGYVDYNKYLAATKQNTVVKDNHVTTKPFTWSDASFEWFKTGVDSLLYRKVDAPVLLPSPFKD